MSDHPCREPECVGLAETAGGQCKSHALGFRRRPLHGPEVRCATCKKIIGPQWWYRLEDGAIRHLADCKPHRDVLKARETAARQKAATR